MLPDEHFVSDMEEKFIHWDDDAEMMISLMNGFFQKPASLILQKWSAKKKWILRSTY